jgi:adenosylcobinamide-phosphate synthase
MQRVKALSYLALLIAVVCETFLSDGVFTRLRSKVNSFNHELEINLEALGAPGYAHLQWLVPMLIWVLGVYFLYQVLWVISPLAAGFFAVFLLLYGLRFRHFAVVFTNAQLFLNQGDFFRARELLLIWMKEYDGSEPVVHRPSELVFQAIYHGTERALRQYFSLFFWFLALPGPMGLVVYLMTHWSVIRERDEWLAQAFAHERPSMQEAWEANKLKAAISPRFVLFAMEWLPARLLAFTVGLVAQLDDAALAWRTAKNHSRFSNRAPLTAVFFTAVGLVGGAVFDSASKAATEGQLLNEENQVQALQQFRQLVFKCAVVWLAVAFAFALFGWLPSSLP